MKSELIPGITSSCADVRIYNVEEERFYEDRAVVFLEKGTSRVIAVGNEGIEASSHMADVGDDLISPIECGKIVDYFAAEAMMKSFIKQYIGGRLKRFKGHGALILHEDLNVVEVKAYEDMFYAATGFTEISIIREGVTQISPYHTWDEVAQHLVDIDPKMRAVVEIKKNEPDVYAKITLDYLLENCKRWGVSEEQLKSWMSKKL